MAYNDIFRLRIYQRMHGAQVVNVIHFVEDLAAVGGGASGLATDFVTNMRPTLIARACPQLLFEYVEVQSLVPFSGGPVVVNFPANTVGTQGSSSVSATLAEVLTIYSSRAGRRGRGRIYLAGADTGGANVASGIWLTAQTTRTQAMATALATRYIGIPGTVAYCLGVWSKVIAGPNPPWPTGAFVRATALTVRTIARTQRRRQVGVGR